MDTQRLSGATGRPDRRAFLSLLALGLLWPAAPRVGARRLPRIGLQMASVRDAVAADLQTALQMIASIGYREVEFWTPGDFDPAAVRQTLDRLSLAAPSRLVRMADVFSNWRALLQQTAILGSRYLVCEEIPEEQRRSLDGYAQVAGLLNAAGKITQWGGIQLALRPHADDFAARGSVIPYEFLLDSTNPVLVKLQLDLGVMARAKREPLVELARYPGRFVSVSISNVEPPAHRPEAPAQGQTPLAPMIAVATRAGIEHYFVDATRSGSPWEGATADFDYLSRLEFD